MSIEVRVPTLGESVSEATIATWFKQPGDRVVETDGETHLLRARRGPEPGHGVAQAVPGRRVGP